MKYKQFIQAIIVTTLLTAAADAAADDPPPAGSPLATIPNDKQKQAENLAQKAFEAHARGEFAHAVALYVQAYQLAPSSALLYNTANIYDRKLQDSPLALDFYRKYINAPDADPELVLRATARIAALNAELATKGPAASAPAAPDAKRAPDVSAPPPPEASRAWKVAGVVTAGAGVVGVGIGAVFGLIAKGKNDDATPYCVDKTCSDARGITLRREASSAATVSTVAFTVGAAAIGGGALMYLLAPSRAEAKTGVHVAPVVTAQGAGLQLGGKF